MKIDKLISELRNYVTDFSNEDIASNLLSAHSTRIEGNLMSISDIENFLTNQIPNGQHSILNYYMIDDHKRAIELMKTYLIKDYLSEENLKSIAAQVMLNTGGVTKHVLGEYDTTKGDYRLGLAHAGKKTFVNHEKIPGLSQKLISDLNSYLKQNLNTSEALVVAFYSHYQLIQIHPFGDGNGRTSRILMNYCLLKKDLPMAYVFEEDKIEYYKALNDTSKHNDLNIINDFMFDQYEKSLIQRLENYKALEKEANNKQTKKIKTKKGGLSMSVLF